MSNYKYLSMHPENLGSGYCQYAMPKVFNVTVCVFSRLEIVECPLLKLHSMMNVKDERDLDGVIVPVDRGDLHR